MLTVKRGSWTESSLADKKLYPKSLNFNQRFDVSSEHGLFSFFIDDRLLRQYQLWPLLLTWDLGRKKVSCRITGGPLWILYDGFRDILPVALQLSTVKLSGDHYSVRV